MSDDDYRYWAFISYSHQDPAWCKWLQRAIETYRLPSRFVGVESPAGPLPPRLYPLFRDRDELPGSAELNHNLVDALRASRYMIVICSPKSAASRWVNEEIRQFKALGREERVLALIVDGEPNASDRPELGEPECFPYALRHRVDQLGNLTGESVDPIAADVRPGRDGRKLARLKLIAGMAGIGLDELRQRDRRRRRRNIFVATAAALACTIALAVGLYRYDVNLRLNDFAERGRKELIAGQPARAAAYLAESYRLGNDDPDLRFMLWQAMQDVETLVTSRTWDDELILDAAYTPDGRHVILAQADNTRTQYHLRTLAADTLKNVAKVDCDSPLKPLQYDAHGTLLFTRAGHFGAVDPATCKEAWSLALSPAGRSFMRFAVAGNVAAVSTGGKVSIVDLDTHTVVREFVQAGEALLPALSADGEWLLVAEGNWAGYDHYYANHAVLWHVTDGKRVRDIVSRDDLVDWRFAPDGHRFALASREGAVLVYLPEHETPVARINHPQGATATQWSPDGRTLATAGSSGTIYLWDAATAQARVAMIGPAAGARSLAFMPAKGRLVTTSSDGTLRIWDQQIGKSLATFDAQHGINPVARVSQDGGRVISFGSNEHTLKLWDAQRVKPLQRIGVSDHLLEAAQVTATGERFATLASPSEIAAWDGASASRLATVPGVLPPGGNNDRSESVAISVDGRRLLTSSGVWSADGGAPMLHWGDDSYLDASAWNLEGTRAAYMDKDGNVRVVDVAPGTVLATFNGYPAPTLPLSMSADGTRVAFSTRDGVAWGDAASGKLLGHVANPDNEPLPAQMLRDGRHLLTLRGNTTRIIDTTTGETTATFDTAPAAYDLACDDSLVVAYSGKSTDIFDVATGQHQATLRGSTAGILNSSCDPLRGRLATGGADGVTRIWRIADGTLLAAIPSHVMGSGQLAFFAQGTRLFTSGYDGTVAFWELGEENRSPETVAAIVRCRAPWRIAGRELVEREVDPAACS